MTHTQPKPGWQQRAATFAAAHGLRHPPPIHALDLAAEVGEVAQALLRATAYGREAVADTAALQDELGDALFSLCLLADALDVDLEAALAAALEKYAARMRAGGGPGSPAAR